MLSTAIQNTFIKAGANLTAQLVVQWQAKEPQPLDRQRILEFAIFGFVGAHIGYVWHHLLEHRFPTHPGAHRVAPLAVVVSGEKDKDAPPVLPATSSGPAIVTMADPGSGSSAALQAAAAKAVSWRNIMAKLVADQTVGLAVMITVFLVITNIARVPHTVDVVAIVREKLFALVRAGWHLWPLVAVCNFLWVPVRWRVLVSSCVGFLWNIFLSLVSMTGPTTAVNPGH
jgi:protein Mpv17